jgi:hypothetical protein
MATTVQSFLNELRYENRDFTKHDYDDPQLVVYLNRVVRVLANELSRIRASAVQTVISYTLDDGAWTIDLSTSPQVIAVRDMYVGQLKIRKKPVEWIHKFRAINDDPSAAKPVRFAWLRYSNALIFDYGNNSGSGVTCRTILDAKPTALTLGGNMPWTDLYNDWIREALLTFSSKAKKDNIVPTDAMFQQLFKLKAQREEIHGRMNQKRYYMDF